MSSEQSADASTDIVMNLVGPDGVSLPVRSILSFRRDDPYAVHVSFDTGEDSLVVWTFARQLLADGTQEPTGLGDVRLEPADPGPAGERRLSLSLCSPTGSADFVLDRSTVVDFLSKTYAVVAAGSEIEHLDLDAELSTVLASNG